MLARRIIAVSPDKALGKKLAIALKSAGGVVDLHASLHDLGDLQAPLIVIHLEGEVGAGAGDLVARLGGDTRVIAILPRTNLADVVDIMQASERVAGMLIADDLDVQQLAAMATRVLAGDIFGLDKVVAWGTQIHSQLVGDYLEKSRCIAQVSEFAELMGVRRKYREAIEQCLDEMLMNALYDAPVDEHGQQIFAEIPTKTRISLRVDQKAVVQFACDGRQFAVAVRDAFGSLERSTVLGYLHKCLHSEQQIDRKAGGAGLGLYLMTSSSSEIYFNVLPGVATEALCTFDLETPKVQLVAFGFFAERIDATGRLAAGPSRRLPSGTAHPVERRAGSPPGRRGLIALLASAIVVVAALIAVAAWPRLFPDRRAAVTIQTSDGATIELEGKHAGTAAGGQLVLRDLVVGRAYPIIARLDGHEPRQAVVQPSEGGNTIQLQLVALAATVALDSNPSGAAIAIDGAARGTTPLTLSDLPAGAAVTITFEKAGYQPATVKLDVPRPGKETRLVQPLVLSGDFARIKLVSEPPGAQVVQNGQLLAGVTTPAEVLVEANKPVRFTLTMTRKVPAVIEAFTPKSGADGVVKKAKLVDGANLRVVSNVEGKATVTNASHCPVAALPLECVLAPGNYFVELTLAPVNAPPPKITRTVKVGEREQELKVEVGYVEAGKGKLLQLGPGPGVRRAALEVGARKVTVIAAEPGEPPPPPKTVTVQIKPGATVTAN